MIGSWGASSLEGVPTALALVAPREWLQRNRASTGYAGALISRNGYQLRGRIMRSANGPPLVRPACARSAPLAAQRRRDCFPPEG